MHFLIYKKSKELREGTAKNLNFNLETTGNTHSVYIHTYILLDWALPIEKI